MPAGVVVEGVRVSYPGRRRRATVTALEEVDLTVADGEFVALVGPSGSGKSSLLRVLAGLAAAESGTVEVLGGPPAAAAKAKRIGLVPQSPALLPWRSVLDNVRLPAQVNRRASSHAGADPEALLRAVGLGDVLGRRPHELSGGMRQRVAVARAFALEPGLLLMDEPFAALDELTRQSLWHQLLDVWQAHRATVVFVTHSVVEAVTLADRVVVLSGGTGRPGRVQATIDVPLPRPRPHDVELGDAHRDAVRAVRAALGGAGADGG